MGEIVESNLNLQDKQQELECLELKFERENTRVLENKLKEALKVLDQCQRESASTVNKSANDCGTDVTDSDEGSDEISYNEELFTDQSQISDGSCVSESEYDVSAGTMAKADELDVRVRELWNRLSSKDKTFDHLQTDHQMLDMSV